MRQQWLSWFYVFLSTWVFRLWPKGKPNRENAQWTYTTKLTKSNLSGQRIGNKGLVKAVEYCENPTVSLSFFSISLPRGQSHSCHKAWTSKNSEIGFTSPNREIRKIGPCCAKRMQVIPVIFLFSSSVLPKRNSHGGHNSKRNPVFPARWVRKEDLWTKKNGRKTAEDRMRRKGPPNSIYELIQISGSPKL